MNITCALTHTVLMEKMAKLHIPDEVYNCIKDFYDNSPAADPGEVCWVRTNPPPAGARVWWLKTLELHGCIKVVQ